MRLGVLAICALAIVAASGCDSGNQNQKTQSVGPSASLQPVGRYQILLTGQKALKLDTATGLTWALEASGWKSLGTEPSKTDSETLQKVRTVVEQAVQPLIPVSSYNDNTKRLDAVTEAEKKRQIEKIVQQALKKFDELNVVDELVKKYGGK